MRDECREVVHKGFEFPQASVPEGSDELRARNGLHVRPLVVATGEKPPKLLPAAKIKEDVPDAACPISEECASGRREPSLVQERNVRGTPGQ